MRHWSSARCLGPGHTENPVTKLALKILCHWFHTGLLPLTTLPLLAKKVKSRDKITDNKNYTSICLLAARSKLTTKCDFNGIVPGENRISEMMSLLWWKDTRSSRVSAFAIKKLPSLRPTAKAFPSGEKQQHRPPEREGASVSGEFLLWETKYVSTNLSFQRGFLYLLHPQINIKKESEIQIMKFSTEISGMEF